MKIKKYIINNQSTSFKFLQILVMNIIFLCVVCFGKLYNGSKAELVIVFSFYVGMMFLLIVYLFVHVKPHIYVFLFLMIIGGLLVFAQPILNVPDEVAHFARAEVTSRGAFFIPPKEELHETIQSVVDLSDEVQNIYTQSNVRGQEIDYSKAYISHIAASNFFLMYIPQAIGVTFAKLLGLNVIWLLWLARFFNLLTYALIIMLAIKLAPRLKMLLFMVASLPMSVQQAASCSPDALINATGILLIAYFLFLYNGIKRNIFVKDIVLFWLISVMATVFKVTNIFMAGLVLLLPYKNFGSKRKSYIYKIAIIFSVITMGGLYYLYTASFVGNLEQNIYLESVGVDPVEQIHYIVNNFEIWLKNFGSALIYQMAYYIDNLNCFGWLEYSYPILTPLMTFLFAKICFQEEGYKFTILNKVLLFLMCIGIYASTCFALFLNWTPVGASDMQGVQGRYFIPLIGLLGLLFTGEKAMTKAHKSETDKMHMVDVILILGMACAMSIIMTLTYY
ncbi:DUF2142 domain-containing protein [Lachnoclostridium sp. An118]|uniref:DUF2142 domain-containing protein n=1 Tax=Lachnoclostridium sp. An118 TaxID=1965547 RepID=UPI0013A67B3F|nr:DUF2142 domain-containing protein [Lachnoclostridium sp. An118]